MATVLRDWFSHGALHHFGIEHCGVKKKKNAFRAEGHGSGITVMRILPRSCSASRIPCFFLKKNNRTRKRPRWWLQYCVESRANRLLRNIPPDITLEVACLHDNCLWASVLALCNTFSALAVDISRSVVSLAIRHGRLGLRPAGRTRIATYWGAWSDCLPFFFPDLANDVRTHLTTGITLIDCLVSLRAEKAVLDTENALVLTLAPGR